MHVIQFILLCEAMMLLCRIKTIYIAYRIPNQPKNMAFKIPKITPFYARSGTGPEKPSAQKGLRGPV